jgi:hypothetical protein
MPHKRPQPDPWWDRRIEYLAATSRASEIEAERLRERQRRERERERRRALLLPERERTGR